MFLIKLKYEYWVLEKPDLLKKIETLDSKPFRIFFRVPSKLAPATALQALARFQVLLTSIAWPAKSP